MNGHVIVKPVITEKSMNDAVKGVFTFIVEKLATKDDIKLAVELHYNVHVTRVTTNNVKEMRTRFTRYGKNVSNLGYKKARVRLKKGENIGIFEEIIAEASKKDK